MEQWEADIAKIIAQRRTQPQTCAVEVVAKVQELRRQWLAEWRAERYRQDGRSTTQQ